MATATDKQLELHKEAFKRHRKNGLAWLEPPIHTDTREQGRQAIETYGGVLEL